MYGGDEFNAHLLLRYGYTKDFVEWFAPLVYRGVELPLNMLRAYHVFIRDIVDKQRENHNLVERKRKEWGFQSMKEVQVALQRLPDKVRDWGQAKDRNIILMCGQFVDMAISQYSDRKVMLLHSNPYDLRALEGKKLPPGFSVFSVHEQLLQWKMPKDVLISVEEILMNRATSRDSYTAQHEVFSHPRFNEWMRGQTNQALILVKILDDLLVKYPIGMILDHSELIYPGSILALLARKHGLPFINVQNHLTSDASIIPSRATHYAVWGPYMREWLSERGVSGEQIWEIGSLRLENNAKSIGKTREDLLAYYQLPEQRLLITYTTECYVSEINYQLMAWFEQLVKEQPVIVIVKAHPSDRMSYDDYLSDRILLSPHGFDLQEILNASDIVATISSTTALEGAMLGKGILALQPKLPYDYHINYNGYPYHLSKAGAGIIAKSAQELSSEAGRLLQESGYYQQVVDKGQMYLNHTMVMGTESPSERLRRFIDQLRG
ncbi:hypothetical protein GK047_21200 [Paenibacillus sp. SYP-B3998]|uniref:Uncharacterized protein n=1 Tax=Paenibacillus sp. SYP-B3998 TaxID=2678564 RepID=A0A6G4A3X8_9BACL|nr:hypothetical protein [Paenibacillus sp. SYP-B3998]NEW08519.1 hypothetical protein [Paenibacillus sp. SYP-B3998]